MNQGQLWTRTNSLDGGMLLLSHTDCLGARRQRRILVVVLAQQVQELALIRGDGLSQLRIAGAELLKDALEHLGLLLD